MELTHSIPFGRPMIGDAERNAVAEVLAGPILTHGPRARAFEQRFATYAGTGTALAVSSGTAALHMAYLELGIGPGDHVLVPAQTHVATVHAVELVGARPIFVDCEPATGNVTAKALREAFTPETKAVSVVHFVGIPCDMDSIMEVANERGVHVVEDCALALGARFKNRHVGLFGDAGCFSFYPAKHITTGDGGMLLSANPEFAKGIAKWRAFGVDKSHDERDLPGIYDVIRLGMNYRMSDINAAIGFAQMDRLPDILAARERNFQRLALALRDVEGLRILGPTNPDAKSAYYCLTAVLARGIRRDRDEALRQLTRQGFGCTVHYPHPVPRLTYYRERYEFDQGAFPHATEISDLSVALPVGPHLSESDIDLMCDRIPSILTESVT